MPMQISSLTKSYGTDVILENISMNIADNEKVAIIGANGAGKTTLLRIIAGELSHDSGSILLPKDSKIGFLKQNAVDDSDNTMWEEMMSIFEDVISLESEMRSLEEKMSVTSDADEHQSLMDSYSRVSAMFDVKGGFEIQTRIKTVLSGMGFDGFDPHHTRVSNLSGGEKTKFAMAKLLLKAPGVLLLDEPTNHLDFKTMQWLEGYLKSYRGIIITVSHDRYFLDALVDTIYEIENTSAVKYPGNYSLYLEQKKHNYEVQLKHYEAQRDEIKRLEDYVAANKARASTAKSAASKQKAIDRMDIIEKPTWLKRECRFKFEIEFPSYKDVLICENMDVCVNDGGIVKTLCSGVELDVKRGEKVAIIGSNGIGKSTLLKTLTGQNTCYGGGFEFGRNVTLGFYDQEQKLLHDSSDVLGEIWDRYPRMDEVEVRNLLATVLFTDEDVYKKVSSLSGGERARLALLVIMLEKNNTLLLDEPTNHLDLTSKEALDVAVKDFDGTVILVSHDRYFLNKTADKILELTPGGINVYPGNYDDYLIRKSQEAQQISSSGEKELSAAESYEMNKRKQANIRNLNKKIENAESRIEALEERINTIKGQIIEAGSDYSKVKELYDENEKYESELNALYELWNTLSKELESIV